MPLVPLTGTTELVPQVVVALLIIFQVSASCATCATLILIVSCAFLVFPGVLNFLLEVYYIYYASCACVINWETEFVA